MGQRLAAPALDSLTSFTEESIFRALQLQPVATPETGDGLALSVVQALVNYALIHQEQASLRVCNAE